MGPDEYTDDARTIAARSVRAYASIPTTPPDGAEAWRLVGRAICQATGRQGGYMLVLADLLDRPTCSMDGTDGGARCSRCLRTIDYLSSPGQARFCPGCGARIVRWKE